MAGEATLHVIGNLTDDPELRYTKSGNAVCAFSVANTPRTKNASTGTWEDEPTVYYNCTVWGPYGENVANSLRKGQRVIVQGGVHDDSWTNKEGQNVKGIKIVVDSVGPDLRFATATATSSRAEGKGAPSPAASTSFTPARPASGFDAPPF